MFDAFLASFPVLSGLFGAAFLAATVVPMQSEALLVGLLLGTNHSPALLVSVAGCGNILGAILNWWLGRSIQRFRDRPWFPVKTRRLTQATWWYHRYGRWSLLLSWAPIIGDPITVIAGVLGEPLLTFVLIAGTAKLLRYLALTAATLHWLA